MATETDEPPPVTLPEPSHAPPAISDSACEDAASASASADEPRTSSAQQELGTGTGSGTSGTETGTGGGVVGRVVSSHYVFSMGASGEVGAVQTRSRSFLVMSGAEEQAPQEEGEGGEELGESRPERDSGESQDSSPDIPDAGEQGAAVAAGTGPAVDAAAEQLDSHEEELLRVRFRRVTPSLSERAWQACAQDYSERYCGHCNTNTDIKEVYYFSLLFILIICLLLYLSFDPPENSFVYNAL